MRRPNPIYETLDMRTFWIVSEKGEKKPPYGEAKPYL
jgi:hypothetical protein